MSVIMIKARANRVEALRAIRAAQENIFHDVAGEGVAGVARIGPRRGLRMMVAAA